MAEAAREGGREARGGDARPNRGREEEKGGGVEVKEETEVNNRNGKLFPPPPPKLPFPPSNLRLRLPLPPHHYGQRGTTGRKEEEEGGRGSLRVLTIGEAKRRFLFSWPPTALHKARGGRLQKK